MNSWPGTKGPKGLRFECNSVLDSFSTIGDLISVRLGRWEDVQLHNDRGLLIFSVRHEGLIGVSYDLRPKVRLEGSAFQETQTDAQPLETSVIAFLFATQ